MAGEQVGGAKALPQLPYDAVFRIEVSLSSQTTSVIVMRTTARLYILEGAHSGRPTSGKAEWRPLAYGAPCIQLLRHDNAVFTVRVVIAEVESGISLWETVVDSNSRYGAMQSNFHTFTAAGKTYAIQFVSEEEAGRMLESVQDLLSQQQKLAAATQQLPRPPDITTPPPAVFKKPSKPLRKLSKKDISSPCNFKHVSGITMQRTSSCEQELKGTIQRKMRSLSLTNLHKQKTAEEGVQSVHSGEKGQELGRKPSKRGKSYKRKTSKDSPASTSRASLARTDPARMSLPSHFRPRQRMALQPTSFIPPSDPHHTLNKSHSQSSGDIPAGISPHQPSPHPPSTQAVDHKHTMLDHSTATRPVSYHQPTSAGGRQPMLSDTSLKRVSTGDIKRGPGEVQHVAIAESDIIGWTEDGRLLVQMQAPAGPVGSVHDPARRASTGQFPTFAPHSRKTDSSSFSPVHHTIPTPSGAPQRKADGSSSSSPIHHTLPTPSGAPQRKADGSSSSSPIHHTLPTPYGAPQRKADGSFSSPIHHTLPTPYGAHQRKADGSSFSSPVHHTIPTPSGAPQRKADGSFSSPVHHTLPTPSTSTFEPPRKIFYHPPYENPAPRDRPLPLTPLDIAMPQSHAMRTKRITHPVANGIERPVTMVTNQPIKQASVQRQSVATSQEPAGIRRHGTPLSSHSSSSCSPPSSPDPITNETTPPPPSHHHNNSTDATLQEVTDQMSRALAQFDDLLGVAQTTL